VEQLVGIVARDKDVFELTAIEHEEGRAFLVLVDDALQLYPIRIVRDRCSRACLWTATAFKTAASATAAFLTPAATPSRATTIAISAARAAALKTAFSTSATGAAIIAPATLATGAITPAASLAANPTAARLFTMSAPRRGAIARAGLGQGSAFCGPGSAITIAELFATAAAGMSARRRTRMSTRGSAARFNFLRAFSLDLASLAANFASHFAGLVAAAFLFTRFAFANLVGFTGAVIENVRHAISLAAIHGMLN
jgi:hypothetical protein